MLIASRDAIFDDLAVAYQKAVRAFYDAGCRYLQFDDTAWAYLCSQEELKKARERGLDRRSFAGDLRGLHQQGAGGKPADMTITTHVCRGNFRSTFISSGGYEPVAESLLGQVQLRRLLPRIRHRPRRRLRAAALPAQGQEESSCSASSPRRPDGWSRAPTSRSASRKPRKYVALDQLACRRNAALPRRKKATCSPKRSNGQSCK